MMPVIIFFIMYDIEQLDNLLSVKCDRQICMFQVTHIYKLLQNIDLKLRLERKYLRLPGKILSELLSSIFLALTLVCLPTLARGKPVFPLPDFLASAVFFASGLGWSWTPFAWDGGRFRSGYSQLVGSCEHFKHVKEKQEILPCFK